MMSKKTVTEPKEFKRSLCPVTNTLDIIGDKWTLLVVRDLFAGKKTYNEFANSPEAMPTNILADRLKRLQEQGIVNKTPYQQRPVRYSYTLTAKGKALGEILLAMKKWGEKYISGTKAMI